MSIPTSFSLILLLNVTQIGAADTTTVGKINLTELPLGRRWSAPVGR